ncbi:hypothetical protein [Porphyrobacter sp. YT40]|uniref:hypothetical protein n=1 Tax=Porphyrobacter sp. YT40 TaxID=2547601 RepID=UPI00114311A7|nr:hypothetical protein [Porphyrobacter sp. YT40]QDH33980.1 hypothetical protein E2E27_06310 [Porphyrobacter sp. YT40]
MTGLAFVVHVGDAFRAWSVPGALLSIVLIAPIAWKLGRLLLARSLQRQGWQNTAEMVAVAGTLDESIRRPGPRFITLAAALVFMVAIMIAGAAIPLSRVGWSERAVAFALEQYGMAGADRTFWNGLMAFCWGLWASGCWAIAIAFSPRPAMMLAAAGVLGVAAFVATQGIGGPIL